MCRRRLGTCTKKNGDRIFKTLSSDGKISCRNIQKYGKGRNNCRAYRAKRGSVRRILGTWAGHSERIRNEIEERHAQIEELGKKA